MARSSLYCQRDSIPARASAAFSDEPLVSKSELPIYESEAEDAPKEKWEWIGLVRNEKLPPGLPISDIMVEMSIDRDGILSVASYLKNDPLRDDPEKGTLEKHSFHFGGQEQKKSAADDPAADVEFHIFMFDVIAHVPSLKKHLKAGQPEYLKRLIGEAQEALQSGDESRLQSMRGKMLDYRKELPVPVEDLFFAELISENKEVVSPVERSQVQQEMMRMETAAAQGDFDTANDHLNQLREKLNELLNKYQVICNKK